MLRVVWRKFCVVIVVVDINCDDYCVVCMYVLMLGAMCVCATHCVFLYGVVSYIVVVVFVFVYVCC